MIGVLPGLGTPLGTQDGHCPQGRSAQGCPDASRTVLVLEGGSSHRGTHNEGTSPHGRGDQTGCPLPDALPQTWGCSSSDPGDAPH